MEHIVRFKEGYDCIKFNCVNDSERCIPGSGGSHGKHGLSIRFVSKGDKGAVQFLLYTGWLPQHVKKDSIGYRCIHKWGDIDTLPADLGYHSKTPIYGGQKIMAESCEFCNGQPCYYDGSSLNATDAMYALVNGGASALWTFLDAYYDHVFSGGMYPEPAEYKKSLR